MSDNFDPATFALQMVSDEDPFDWDWARLQKEVDEATMDFDALESDKGLSHCVTHGSLEEGPTTSDWWSVEEAPHANAPCSTLAGGPDLSHEAELWPDRGVNANLLLSVPEQGNMSDIIPTDNNPPFVCDFQECKKGFMSKGNLSRHQKSHAGTRQFRCPALQCEYTFTRKDKCMDHIWAGHDDDTVFNCAKPDCHVSVTRDVLYMHLGSNFVGVQDYRQCPLPKCSCRTWISTLDTLQQHLLKKHDTKGRKRFATTLANRGYDHESAKVLCPLCPEDTVFENHGDFQSHFIINHCPHPQMRSEEDLRSLVNGPWYIPVGYLRGCSPIPDEVREHRRTILSVWPAFKDHPVWNDVKRCRY